MLPSKVLLENDTRTVVFNEDVTYRKRETVFPLLIFFLLSTQQAGRILSI